MRFKGNTNVDIIEGSRPEDRIFDVDLTQRRAVVAEHIHFKIHRTHTFGIISRKRLSRYGDNHIIARSVFQAVCGYR